VNLGKKQEYFIIEREKPPRPAGTPPAEGRFERVFLRII
jgi:hypothetical protein